MKKKLIAIIKILIPVIIGVLAGVGVDLAIRPTQEGEVKVEASYTTLELSEKQVPAVVEDENGNTSEIDLPTVESVEGEQVSDEELDFGQGAFYDTSSPTAFKNSTLGKCIDFDSKFGAQCVDLAQAFVKSYANRWWSTCGTGAARGLWDCRDKNAGEDFELITDQNQLQAGDIVVFNGGQYGHVGMAMGPASNGYVALLGENQGGKGCSGGGAATNMINMSLATFRGAFRPKAYVVVEPKPEPTPAPVTHSTVTKKCESWTLKKGDTLGKIMLYCEGKVEWGQAMEEYAKTWYSPKHNGLVVWDGWHLTANGVGLYAGDTIVRKNS